MKANCRGPGITLAPPFRGALAIVLWIGAGAKRYCTELPLATLTTNQAGLTVGREAGAPAVCPDVGGLAVRITAPTAGGTLQSDSVSVRGTVQGPANTGVNVNGVVAVVQDGTFVADAVPSTVGRNTLTATATTPAGQTATDALDVTTAAVHPAIAVTARPASGINPLLVTFDYDVIGTAVQSIRVDFDGDGNFDFTTADTTVPLVHDYTTPGMYSAHLEVTDAAGATTDATATVAVQDFTTFDALAQNIWNGMNAALVAGDVTSAASLLSQDAAAKYVPVWQALLPQMTTIAMGMSAPKAVSVGADIAEYAVNRTINAENRLFLIEFLREGDGVWRIDGM